MHLNLPAVVSNAVKLADSTRRCCMLHHHAEITSLIYECSSLASRLKYGGEAFLFYVRLPRALQYTGDFS